MLLNYELCNYNQPQLMRRLRFEMQLEHGYAVILLKTRALGFAIPAHGRGVGTRCSLWSLPTQTIQCSDTTAALRAR